MRFSILILIATFIAFAFAELLTSQGDGDRKYAQLDPRYAQRDPRYAQRERQFAQRNPKFAERDHGVKVANLWKVGF